MVYMERVNRVQGKRVKWQDGKAKEEEAEGRETQKGAKRQQHGLEVGIWCQACNLSLIPREKAGFSVLS